MKNLKELLTEEELYDVCVSLLAIDDGYNFEEGIAGQIVTARACQEIYKETGEDEFNVSEISSKTGELIASKSFELMVKKGLFEPDFDNPGHYIPTEKGKKIMGQFADQQEALDKKDI